VGPWELSLHEYGDAGLLVRVACADPELRWGVAHRLADELQEADPAGLVDLVAGFADLFLAFDPLVTDHATLGDLVRCSAGPPTPGGPGREYLVPVVYGGDHGPDLVGVARDLGIGTEDVVAAHCGTPWTVRLRGAPCGAPMMDGPRTPLPVPRCAQPRVRVPVGSVALSGFQSVIYPVPSPGGWRLIGRTPVRLVDPRREPATEYRPGDRLRFVPVPAGSWAGWEGALGELQGPLRALRGEVDPRA
jgi:KipI family sensor histidine kinase inhibitor